MALSFAACSALAGCLSAGRMFMFEKPLAMDLAEADAIIAAGEKRINI